MSDFLRKVVRLLGITEEEAERIEIMAQTPHETLQDIPFVEAGPAFTYKSVVVWGRGPEKGTPPEHGLDGSSDIVGRPENPPQ